MILEIGTNRPCVVTHGRPGKQAPGPPTWSRGFPPAMVPWRSGLGHPARGAKWTVATGVPAGGVDSLHWSRDAAASVHPEAHLELSGGDAARGVEVQRHHHAKSGGAAAVARGHRAKGPEDGEGSSDLLHCGDAGPAVNHASCRTALPFRAPSPRSLPPPSSALNHAPLTEHRGVAPAAAGSKPPSTRAESTAGDDCQHGGCPGPPVTRTWAKC